MHVIRNTTWSIVAVLLVPSALFTGCKSKDEVPATEVSVEAVTVAQQPLTQEVTADAVLAPLAQAAITPKITAPVHKFYVQRGAKVKAGQLLAVLENRDLTAAEIDNKGAYEQAQAAYATATKASVPEDYQKAEQDVAQTKANLDLQQSIVNARTTLFAQGAIPGRDLDTAKASLVQAQAAYDIAAQHLASQKAVTREAAIQSAKGQLLSAEGKYQGAQAGVSYSEIRSPIDGVVTERPLFAGEIAATGQPLLTVMDVSSLLAKTHLSQVQAQQMHVGDEAEVTAPGVDEPLKGKVTLISPALDPGSTTVEVWVKVPNRRRCIESRNPSESRYRAEDHSKCSRRPHRRHRHRQRRQETGHGHRTRQYGAPPRGRTGHLAGRQDPDHQGSESRRTGDLVRRLCNGRRHQGKDRGPWR